MGHFKKGLCLLISVLGLAVLLPAQSIGSQYEDEAPFRTWNVFGIPAGSTGAGLISLAFPIDVAAVLTNPALITIGPEFEMSVNFSLNSADFDRYSIINSGVLIAEKTPRTTVSHFDFLGIAFHGKQWGASISWGILENYRRPPALARYPSEGQQEYSLGFDQSGILNNFNLSLSRKWGRWNFGLGFNFILGRMERNIIETWDYVNVIITDEKSHEFKGIYFTFGTAAAVSEKLTIAASIRFPFIKKAAASSSLRYQGELTDTDIIIEAEADNRYHMPLRIGLGFGFRPVSRLRFGADIYYTAWSNYQIQYFEENLTRDFKDVILFGLGFEYTTDFRAFGKTLASPLRVGLLIDPQPTRPSSPRYACLSIGSGISWGNFRLNTGLLYGRGNGSGSGLSVYRFTLTLQYLRGSVS